jgi:hypothetical protein
MQPPHQSSLSPLPPTHTRTHISAGTLSASLPLGPPTPRLFFCLFSVWKRSLHPSLPCSCCGVHVDGSHTHTRTYTHSSFVPCSANGTPNNGQIAIRIRSCLAPPTPPLSLFFGLSHVASFLCVCRAGEGFRGRREAARGGGGQIYWVQGRGQVPQGPRLPPARGRRGEPPPWCQVRLGVQAGLCMHMWVQAGCVLGVCSGSLCVCMNPHLGCQETPTFPRTQPRACWLRIPSRTNPTLA